MLARPRNFTDPAKYLWTDLPDAAEHLRAMTPAADPETLLRFITEGAACLPDAVAPAAIEAFLAELETKLEDPGSSMQMTYWAEDGKRQEKAIRANLDKPEAKVLDVHSKLETSHAVIFSPPLLAFLRDVFQDEPVAFQSLYFDYGPEQAAHQDTAFVAVDPAYQMAAIWIALEDIGIETGEVFYFPRSHAAGEVLFANGGKQFDPNDPHSANYSANLERFASHFGLRREVFGAKQGDALVWNGDLIHGDSKILHRRSRRSLLTHFCPQNASVPYARAASLTPRALPDGGLLLSAT